MTDPAPGETPAPDTAALDGQVRVAIYHHFADTGAAPTLADLAVITEASDSEVTGALERLDARRAIVLQPGTHGIWMAMPFSAVPTPYRVSWETGSAWANCAFDAFGIPAALAVDATIQARDPMNGDELELTVHHGRLDESEMVVHFAVPARHWWDDIGLTCATNLLFRSEGDAVNWCLERGQAVVGLMAASTCWELARLWYADRLTPTWHDANTEAMRARFAAVGLDGRAWELPD